MKQIVLGLPPELVDALEHLGGRDDAAIGDILRNALRHDLRRRLRTKAVKTDKALAPLRAQLSDDLTAADDWNDVQIRLRKHGYRFVKSGGGLTLADRSGKEICSAADLGFRHAKFIRRFGIPFSHMATSFARAV
ncbi:hypothetical protein [Yoonia sp.]|jgi:hypothetical protein|uniref:hypothetical protein n=1 Tax=Yoonia sp. TaxID=2212373 RepID=UPI0025FBD507|nr:hypothetical protein [Yoonia sp.]